ncbi:hypothetical protein [Terrimonas pollutisoli]|uniref:hypothetical protein n=1 Tax=Terrimonas pollutisoli TaxID=3034147 RepID=UPI0023ED5EF2|nr:hypothetical protein [Terrimonas sp. H1YJ31]
MKKAFIGLLIVAAGAATYYLLQKENNPATSNTIQQEKIIGKWKLDSLYTLKDSANNSMLGIIGIIEPDLKKYKYEFKKDGAITLSVGDSLTADSSRYEWNKNDQFTWMEHPADTSGELFTISLLNNNNLRLLSADSVVLQFTKVK